MKTTFTLLTLGIALCVGPSARADTEIRPETLYRNGGHFGPAGSDVQLEQASAEPAQLIIAGAPSGEAGEPETAPGRAWQGTLYRNGGHFGTANSDEQLEANR